MVVTSVLPPAYPILRCTQAQHRNAVSSGSGTASARAAAIMVASGAVSGVGVSSLRPVSADAGSVGGPAPAVRVRTTVASKSSRRGTVSSRTSAAWEPSTVRSQVTVAVGSDTARWYAHTVWSPCRRGGTTTRRCASCQAGPS